MQDKLTIHNVNNNYLFKIIFVLSNLIVVVALYLAGFNFLLKIFLGIVAIKLNYRHWLRHTFIKGFSFIDRFGKAILLTRENKQIKAHNIEITSHNSIYIIIVFSCKSTQYRVLVLRGKISEELFKSLIILAKYKFLPVFSSN